MDLTTYTDQQLLELNSLTEIQKYSDAEIAANVAMAFRRVFAGMEILARTTRDLARVVD